MTADLHMRQPGLWPPVVALVGLLALTGCGAKPPQGVARTQPQQPASAKEITMLQQQIQQTERSSMPLQVKQQVEANLNAQIRAKQQMSSGK